MRVKIKIAFLLLFLFTFLECSIIFTSTIYRHQKYKSEIFSKSKLNSLLELENVKRFIKKVSRFSPKYNFIYDRYIGYLEKQTEDSYIELCRFIITHNDYKRLDEYSQNKSAFCYSWFRRDRERMHYYITKSINTICAFNHFLNEFPNSGYAGTIIHLRRMQYFNIEELKKQKINIEEIIDKYPCYIPYFLIKKDTLGNLVKIKDVINDSIKNPLFKYRYLVADLSTLDTCGYCRGVKEIHPDLMNSNEFPLLQEISKKSGIDILILANYSKLSIYKIWKNAKLLDSVEKEQICLKNYLDQVHKYKTEPYKKDSVYLYWGMKFCAGQTMSLCELNNDTAKMIARFITSSRGDFNSRGLFGTWIKNYFYAPINLISYRFWDSERRYKDYDRKRDRYMGGGFSGISLFWETKCELPDFLSFKPTRQFKYACAGNGIHRPAVGPHYNKLMGSPSSLGCLRLLQYQAKFTRWWTPTYAKLFIYLDDKRYRQIMP